MMPRVVFGQRTNSDKEQSSTLTAGAAGASAGRPTFLESCPFLFNFPHSHSLNGPLLL
jgi:hypothetical protein